MNPRHFAPVALAARLAVVVFAALAFAPPALAQTRPGVFVPKYTGTLKQIYDTKTIRIGHRRSRSSTRGSGRSAIRSTSARSSSRRSRPSWAARSRPSTCR